MHRIYWLISITCAIFLSGCASRQKTEAAAPPAEIPKAVQAKPAPKSVVHALKSADGSIDGEMVGSPIPGSKFFRLQIGMTLDQVEKLIGPANAKDSRITGKQFQPFHFGGDTQRTEVFYKNEGQLTFSNIHPEDAPDTLIRIVIDPDASGTINTSENTGKSPK